MLDLLLVLAVILLWIQSRRQQQRLVDLENALELLKRIQRAQAVWIEAMEARLGAASPPPPAIPPAGPSADRAPAPPADLSEAPAATPAVLPPPASPPSPRPSAPAASPPTPRPSPTPGQLERLFAEHWSGILGVLVLVAGVTFVAINVALRLGPFPRFLLVSLAAGALALPASTRVGQRHRWRELTAWMRSGGGALFLFACVASGGLAPLGLRWIDDPGAALVLLTLGMGANLALAAIARTEAIASLHVVVNLLPLVIVPQGGLTLAIASVVALVGFGLPPGRPRARHHLIVTWAYAAYHASWFLRAQALLEGGGGLRLGAALAAVLVFGGSALLRQRSRLVAPRLEALPLALQVSSWGALGLALLIYPQQAPVRAMALALAALLLGGLAWRARRRGWRWLQLSNTLVAQAFALAAVVSLQPLIADGPLLLLAVQVECAVFLGLGLVEDDATIRRLGWGLTALAGLLLALAGLAWGLGGGVPPRGLPQTSVVLIAGTLLTTGAQSLLQRRQAPVPLPPLLGWLAGSQAFVAAVIAPATFTRPLLAPLLIGALLAVARVQRPAGLLAGSATAVGLLHLVDWGWLLWRHPLAPPLTLLHLLSLAALAAALLASPAGLLGFDLLGLTAGLGAWLLLEPVAAPLPGVAWLLLSLVALEVANRSSRARALHSLALGLGGLVAFGLTIPLRPWLLVVGPLVVRGRLLIALLAIAVALRWACFPAGPRLAALRVWQGIQPCFLEVALVGVVVTVFTESSPMWRPLVWSLLALPPLLPPLRRRLPIRLQLYGVLLHWLGVVALVTRLGLLASPSPPWGGLAHGIGLMTMASQAGFVVASHRWLDLEALRQPGGLPPLGWLGHRLANHRNAWLYTPLFAAVALYLGVRYDHALLTLLWSAEALGIYALSVPLRERMFRHLALLGLGACLLRLLAVDMARADLGLRGLVFIGVGLLLLALNAIARRFGSRFD